MSVDLQRLCWRVEFPSPAMSSVAVKLADCANDDGENIYPSVNRIERETRLGASTVRRCLAAFEEAGLLDVIDEAHGNKWLRSTTIRRFNLGLLHALSAVEVRRRGADGRMTVELCRSTHVLVERLDGNRKRWVVVERTADMVSDYPPLPQREGQSGGTPPTAGDATNDRPSRSGTPPLPEREGTPPTAGPKPSIEPSKEDSPPQPPSPSPATGERDGDEDFLNGAGNPSHVPGGRLPGRQSPGTTKRRQPDWDRILVSARSADPARNLVLDLLVAPIVTTRRLDAPSASAAIDAIVGYAVSKGLGEKGLRAAAGHLSGRRATVKPSDFEDAIRFGASVEHARATMPAIVIRRGDMAWADWLAHVAATEGAEAAAAIEADGELRAPCRWPRNLPTRPPAGSAPAESVAANEGVQR